MRVSAVRFGADLWQVLEGEAARLGVSVAQYIREASLARAAAAATARGEDPLELLAIAARTATQPTSGKESIQAVPQSPQEATIERARAARRRATAQRSGARALKAQSEQAARHARQITAPADSGGSDTATAGPRPARGDRGKR